MPKQTAFGALLAAAALVAGAAPAASADPPTGHRPLTWQASGAFQCATLTVPQDYLDPAGPWMQLPVIKAPATDPGAPGRDFVR